MRGIFLDIDTIGADDLDLQPLTATLDDWSLLEQPDTGQLQTLISGAEVVVTNKTALDRDTLFTADSLRLICIAATGTNNIDLPGAAERGITVCNVRAYATTSVVEHVFSMMLAFSRQHHNYRQAVTRGDWGHASSFCLLDYPVRELAGQTLGIIGYGELGKAVAQMGEAFGMKILVAQRPGTAGELPAGRTTLQQLLAESDIVSLHCPLVAATHNLIDRHELAQMRSSALLINTARGGIVNEAALADALQRGEIGGAAIDVLSEEPPRHGNPLLDTTIPNLIVTPHIAWAGVAARQTLVNELAANIQAWLNGTPRNVVAGPCH
jgi:glycerate dehydrogenase